MKLKFDENNHVVVQNGCGAQPSGGGAGNAPKSLADCKTDAERVAYMQSKSQQTQVS